MKLEKRPSVKSVTGNLASFIYSVFILITSLECSLGSLLLNQCFQNSQWLGFYNLRNQSSASGECHVLFYWRPPNASCN